MASGNWQSVADRNQPALMERRAQLTMEEAAGSPVFKHFVESWTVTGYESQKRFRGA